MSPNLHSRPTHEPHALHIDAHRHGLVTCDTRYYFQTLCPRMLLSLSCLIASSTLTFIPILFYVIRTFYDGDSYDYYLASPLPDHLSASRS
jgi:hypothetical protein